MQAALCSGSQQLIEAHPKTIMHLGFVKDNLYPKAATAVHSWLPSHQQLLQVIAPVWANNSDLDEGTSRP